MGGMSRQTYTASKRRQVAAERAAAFAARRALAAGGTFAEYLESLGYSKTPEELAELDPELAGLYREDYDRLVAEHATTANP